MDLKSNDQNNGGIIYVLTNEAMPGYVKIGLTTTSVDQRILELSRSTAIPLPFECDYAVRVADVNKVEKALHDAFGDHRINPKREFFSIASERVIAILKLLSLEDVTPSRNVGIESKEEAVAVAKAKKNRAAFNFKTVGIPIGAELKFTRDENITCRVAFDQKNVEFQGEIMSSSRAAWKLLGSPKYGVAGPVYWTYQGEVLDDFRRRFESGDEPSADEIDAAGDAWMQSQSDIARGK